MAYLKDVELNNGIKIEQAYHRIESYNGSKNNLSIYVYIYLNQEAYWQGKTALPISKEYDFIPDTTDTAQNFIKQGYEYIKSLPENSNIIDVLETGQS